MTPAEIVALLDLPDTARARLAAIDGPGWFVSRNLDESDAKATALANLREYGEEFRASVVAHGREWAWCPADTFAIVQACGAAPSMAPYRRPAFCASVKGTGGYGATPRLAALVLLMAVCERDS